MMCVWCLSGVLLGPRPAAVGESVALASEAAIHVPHELPGQDPEGGSEVNFSMQEDSSSAACTPRADLSRHDSGNAFNDTSADGAAPRSPTAQVRMEQSDCCRRCFMNIQWGASGGNERSN
jgi:hypothetical protein